MSGNLRYIWSNALINQLYFEGSPFVVPIIIINLDSLLHQQTFGSIVWFTLMY